MIRETWRRALWVSLLALNLYIQPLYSFAIPSLHSGSTNMHAPQATSTSSSDTAKAVSSSGKVFDEFSTFILKKQKDIIGILEGVEAENPKKGGDAKKFCVDEWTRDLSFGATCVLEDGNVLEKAAVSVSIIHGNLTPERAAAISSRGKLVEAGVGYSAAAISLVLHSRNPNLPTFRSDIRYFQCEGLPGWVGGGADLTPYYLYNEDVTFFHDFYKKICDRYEPDAYSRFKKWADDYFYIPMRKEHRGVGGVFFDDVVEMGGEGAVKFAMDIADGFMPSYLPIIAKRNSMPYTEEQRQWQLVRRGRYLEFNLLYDRGVKFGLSGGRVESVMVSAPPLIAWKYNLQPSEDSEEGRLLKVLRQPKEWI